MKIKLLNTLTAAILFLIPSIIFAQAPDLGTAADFVLFSSDGAVSNSGVSQLTGNVGNNNGYSTGFGNVNGVMHDNDIASAQCSSDLLTAYNYLDSRIPTFFPSNLLGNGQTLVAGVYSIPSAATLNLNLILNAKGNPNAIFIFQIEGSFSTNASSKIKLINGAKACNVYWKVEGLVNMASGTTMRGTVIANNAAIIMNTNDTLEGRALSTTGAVTVDGVLAYTPIGCGSPVLNGPAAPALASAECYALFSSDGPVTNLSGITNVTGDVGTNVGLTTGYNSLNVTGMIHPIADASTAACAADLLNVYNYLNTVPYDIELLYPAQFGNNLVLTPHTYLMNSAVTFTDTLYLNAEDNTNAVFVIQVNGAFITSTHSKVILINGAQAENVYWKIDGAVDIKDNSHFKGTIVANNGAVDLKTGVTLDGRAFTTTGTLTTTASTVIMPAGCSSGPPNIATQPNDEIVCEGNSVRFSVIAHGTDLTYQWRKGVTNLVNGGNISGAHAAILTISSASSSDAASNYNVIVGGTSDVTSENAALVVNSLLNITSQPINETGCVGSSVSLSVTATGSGLVYRWKKGGLNIINGGNISGAHSAVLTFNPMSASDISADYTVVITGKCLPADTSSIVSISLCTTTGITSLDAGNIMEAISIYPNPFANSINILINETSEITTAELRIYNVLGAEVMNRLITKKLVTLETNSLPSGIYFYKVNSNNKTIQSGKLISQQ